MRCTRLLILVLLLSFALWLLPDYAQARELKEIRHQGSLRIAVKDNIRPLGFRDGKGQLQGLEIDLARRLAEDLLQKPHSLQLKPVNNRDRLAWVLENQVDIAIARVTATPARSRLVNFSIPYYLDSTVLITKNSSLQRLVDLKSRKIAVLRGSSTVDRVNYFIPNAEIVGVNSYQQAYQQLEQNQVDAFAADGSILTGWTQLYPGYRLLPIRLSTEPLAVVIPKGLQHDQLRQEINQAIARYLETGWLQERIEYWGLLPSQLQIPISESTTKDR